ncbi:MAG: glycosyltransferase [Vicinamibacterales bacterium]
MHIGGAENVVRLLAGSIDRNRFTVGLCCTKESGVMAERVRQEAPEVDVMLAKSPPHALRYLTPLAVRRVFTQFSPDIVHTHGRPALLHTGPLALAGQLPAWVHTFHFGNYDALSPRAVATEGFFARRASHLVAVSDRQRQSVLDRHGIDPDCITTIVNGVLPNPYRSDPEVAARKRAELGLSPSDFVVGTIAALSEQKGVIHLLRAARQVLDGGARVRFLIVGGGPLESSLRSDARALGLGSDVIFTGWRPDSLELMTALDLFVMSSLWEAMPMALLEAMAARRGIVVTDVGDNRRVVDDGRCGLVVPPADAGALAGAISTLVHDATLLGALREAAVHRYEQHYSVDRMATAYEELYMRLAG